LWSERRCVELGLRLGLAELVISRLKAPNHAEFLVVRVVGCRELDRDLDAAPLVRQAGVCAFGELLWSTPTRCCSPTSSATSEAVKAIFGEFRGLLQADASSVYEILARGRPPDTDDGVTLVAAGLIADAICSRPPCVGIPPACRA
jgi:hypothetical protein